MYLNTLSCKLITMHVASKDKNMPCKIFIMRGQAKVATILLEIKCTHDRYY